MLSLSQSRGECLEHLCDSLVEVPFVLFGLIGHRVLGTTAPDHLPGFCVVQVDNQGSVLRTRFMQVSFLKRGCICNSKTLPTRRHAYVISNRLFMHMSLRNFARRLTPTPSKCRRGVGERPTVDTQLGALLPYRWQKVRLATQVTCSVDVSTVDEECSCDCPRRI